MDWFALPLFVAVHTPIFLAVQWLTGWHSFWGGIASVVAYYTVYEYFHFCMHVPDGRWFERNPIFRFVKEHHRIHHKYMQQNLNVFFPLADKCLGTYRSAASLIQKPEAAPAAPEMAPPAAAASPASPAAASSRVASISTRDLDAVGAEK